MKVYADTSFLVKLVANEPGSESAMAEFRRLGFPPLYFLPLHALEVANAIHQRVFHLRRTVPGTQRASITRERDAALARIDHWLRRGWFLDVTADSEEALRAAQRLSEMHTERLGCRGFDLLHVALALRLESEVFLTADNCQSKVAKSEGLDIILVAD